MLGVLGMNDRDSTELPDWVPEGIDVTVPNAARMYDYILGGYHNFAVDRESIEELERVFPGIRRGSQETRAFLGRAIRWLADAGIRQFLDIGSGIPTLGNVHEIAEQVAPGARVMYVDIDPVAVAHTREILAGNPWAKVLQGDLRRPIDIVDHPDVTDLLDFSEPVAVVLSAVFHFVSDEDDPFMIITQLRNAVVSGSYIAMSHVTPAAEHAEGLEGAKHVFHGENQTKSDSEREIGKCSKSYGNSPPLIKRSNALKVNIGVSRCKFAIAPLP
jgi:S-adenosyl methyltransferase